MDVVELEVEWFGRWRSIRAYVSDVEPLVGVSLLEGYRLCVDFVPDSEMRVTPL